MIRENDIELKYIENVHRLIAQLGSIELQRKLWLNEDNDTGLISSYVELMCGLFDDFNFESFVDEIFPKIAPTKNAIYEIETLRKLLNAYEGKKTQEEILDDPEWKKIADQAKKVLLDWEISN